MTNSAQSGLQFSEILKSSDQLSNLQADIGLVSVDDLLQEIGIHPYAAAYPAELAEDAQQQLLAKTDNNPAEFFVSALAAKLISAAQKAGEKPLKVRLAGADSHQRLSLLGSELETQEVNPLIGKRGVSRWLIKRFVKLLNLSARLSNALALPREWRILNWLFRLFVLLVSRPRRLICLLSKACAVVQMAFGFI